MKIGIIGLPMSGKTTLFRLLTGAPALAQGAHPGRVDQRQTTVDDPRLARLAADYNPRKVTQATLDFLDFPSLASASEERRAKSAELLAPAREAQGLLIVVRSFESLAVPPISGRIDPQADLEDLLVELRLADLQAVTGRIERVEKSIPRKHGDERRALELELSTLRLILEQLEQGHDAQDAKLDSYQERAVRGFQFLTAKPRLVVENTGAGGIEPHAGSIAVAAALELELAELDPEAREVFAAEYGFTAPARDRVITEIYRRVGLISFLTAGEPEVRAWTIPHGHTAQEAAGAIHSDLARGFIRAEVVAYDHYVADGGMTGAREKGHLRLEGKEYIVHDGDIILFRFSV